MLQHATTVLGIMSGTSLDGVDLCYTAFSKKEGQWTFQILHSQTIPYTEEQRHLLEHGYKLGPADLKNLDHWYGQLLGNLIKDYLSLNHLPNPALISSHGHTIHHIPEQKITTQIGNGPEIQQITGIDVVCNFRMQDVLLGGQGAPLVPIGDELLFYNYTACLNLGGFSNISYHNQERIAFDICPVNIVLNSLSQSLGLPYDDGGRLAKKGHINKTVLEELDALPYYQQSPPKSLGREWVEANLLPILAREPEIINRLATFTEHAAKQCGKVLAGLKPGRILASGGGCYNTHLIQRMTHYAQRDLIIPDSGLINQKEALIFGFLGLLRYQNQINCLKSVTGAIKNHSSGRVFRKDQ
jgi:anhydro-N-acetylmuramic acid kinase